MKMKHDMDSIHKITKVLCKLLLFLSMFLMVSCAASLHRGQVTVPKPLLNETTEAIWLNYWQDQFDGYEGNVIAPTAEYPEVAKQSYQRAKLNWDSKVMEAHTKTTMAWVVGSLVSTVILISMATSAAK